MGDGVHMTPMPRVALESGGIPDGSSSPNPERRERDGQTAAESLRSSGTPLCLHSTNQENFRMQLHRSALLYRQMALLSASERIAFNDVCDNRTVHR